MESSVFTCLRVYLPLIAPWEYYLQADILRWVTLRFESSAKVTVSSLLMAHAGLVSSLCDFMCVHSVKTSSELSGRVFGRLYNLCLPVE